MIFSSVATDSDGLIYLAVGQYKLAEGLPVVELDQKGNVLGGFRVTLPTFENLKTAQTPTGYMAVSKIAIAGNHLYGLDTGGRVAVYAVP